MNMFFENGWMYMGVRSVFGMFFIPKLGTSVDEISWHLVGMTKTIGQFSRGINSKSLPFWLAINKTIRKGPLT